MRHVLAHQLRDALERTLYGARARYPSDLQIETTHLTRTASSVFEHDKSGLTREGAVMRGVQIDLVHITHAIALNVPQSSPDMRG